MKFNIIRQIPTISDQEIQSKQNFDKLLKERVDYLKFVKKTRKLRLLLATSALILIIAAFALIAIKKQENLNKPSFKAPLGQIKMDIYLKEALDIPQPRKPVTLEEKKANLTNDKKQKTIKSKPVFSTIDSLTKQNKTVKSSNKYIKAYPLVGMDSLQRYFKHNIRYPAMDLKESSIVEGTVIVLFTIDSLGHPINISIKNSLSPMFDEEAKRLIVNMPKWQPAIINGKPSASQISVPIVFSYEK